MFITEHMQVRSSADRGNATATEDSFTLVEARVTDHRTQHRQSTVKITQSAPQRNAVLLPTDAQLY